MRTSAGERAVGQFPDGSPAEALAYFERKYQELAGQVTILEQRVKAGAAANDVAKSATALGKSISEANAVGDLESLTKRIDVLKQATAELSEQQAEEHKAAIEASILKRTAIVEAAEALAAQDPAKAQWKQTGVKFDELFSEWQEQQKTGPHLPKTQSNELWKRFRDARAKVESQRRAFFAVMDSAQKDAKSKKQELVEKAEALAAKGAEGIPAYRSLLDSWKSAGRAGKKSDDALWLKFKAAGDLLYAMKAEKDSKDDLEFASNFEQKQALASEAESLLDLEDRELAKQKLRELQKKWDEIGKVPRDKIRLIEDRLRKVESAIKKLDDQHWVQSNPEKKARSEGMVSQLEAAIAKLESELSAAKSSGDPKLVSEIEEALKARRAWLAAID